jgi:hypothetical protein
VHLASTPFSDLKENNDAHEVQFLASATAVRLKHVAYRFIAHALGAKHKINEATLFGIFHQGIPLCEFLAAGGHGKRERALEAAANIV